jgi:hypothetical protein
MALESRRLLMDDFDVYSKGLMVALEKEKLGEAREYVPKLQNNLASIGAYLDSYISFNEAKGTYASAEAAATTEAERAVLAAKIAQEKAERLHTAAIDTKQESQRLKKAAENAKKEAARAWKAAEKAEKAERKAQKEAKHAAEHAGKANQAARRS